MRYNNFILLLVLACLGLSACIENDIPYPIVDGHISAMEVEGQTVPAEIDLAKYTVALTVNDSVDLKELRITKLVVTSNAEVVADSLKCVSFPKFPTVGFASLDSIPRSYNTRMDFTKPVTLLLKTYQDYQWSISVTQVFERAIQVENQIGEAIIDVKNCQVVIYVSKNQPLNNLKVSQMNLGGKYGKVIPDPSTITNYSLPRNFIVYRYGKEEYAEKWIVNVFTTDDDTPSTSSEVFATVKNATINGSIQNGTTPIIEYKAQAEMSWMTLDASAIHVTGTSFTASFSGLSPATMYSYRVNQNGVTGEEKNFKTAGAIALTNGSFDEWHSPDENSNKVLWNPWASGKTSFWDTGNKGATTIGSSNSVPSDETSSGSGKAAKLESKYIVMKFAAGNIFAGSYLKTVGTDGVLSFGREFNSFPTKLRIHYKYISKTIDKSNDSAYEYLKGRPDSCCVYIALTDWSTPKEIRTNKNDRSLFNKDDKNVIAYGEFVSGQTTDRYQQLDIPIEYRYANRTPKYMVIVGTSSKYGDYFTGGNGSTLWLDNFELLYD